MYIPASFQITDIATLHGFIRQYSFATLVTAGPEPFITHLPLLLDSERGPNGTLIGHFARPNPHWQLDHDNQPSTAIFQGPHAYISPTWYRSGLPAVPTWNYAVVHATGKMSLLSDAREIATVIDRTVEKYESNQPSPWKNRMSKEITDKLIGGIVAFEMPIDHLEGKFKLGQNRLTDDQYGAIEALESSGEPESIALAHFARKHLALEA